MPSKRKIVFYSICTPLIIGTLLGGIFLATDVEKDNREHSLNGTINSIYCRKYCYNYCGWDYIINVSYTVNNVHYDQLYTSADAGDCDPSLFDPSSICCEDLNGDDVWLDVAESNPAIIESLSFEMEYNTGIRIFGSVILLIASTTSLIVYIYRIYKDYKYRSWSSV